VTGYWRLHSSGATVSQPDTILMGAYAEACAFRSELGAEIGLTEARWAEIERQWAPVRGIVALRAGRRLLVEAAWREARDELGAAMRVAPIGARLLAATGVVGSWAEMRIEWMFRLAGRPWYERSTSGRAIARV
jgi:hypothetical protein